MRKKTLIATLLITMTPCITLAKRPGKVYETATKQRLRIGGFKQMQSSPLKNLVRTKLMSKLTLRDSRILESSVTGFLKESSAKQKEVQGFYNLMLKQGDKPQLTHIKDLFVGWVALNTASFNQLNLISPLQLTTLVKSLSKQEIVTLNSALGRAQEIMKTDKTHTPDTALMKALEEKGVNPGKLRKCKR